MTDPRIAALAEAILAAHYGEDRPPPGSMSASPDWGFEWYASPNEMAAAILAALDGWTLVPVGTAAVDVWSDYVRLRRIEEAARFAANELGVPDDDYPAPVFNAAIALHTALEEKP